MKYDVAKDTPSDINEHIETLYNYATECTHVAELGVRGKVSTWAFLRGLRDSKFKESAQLHYYGFDLAQIDDSDIEQICFENNIIATPHFGVSDLVVDISGEMYDMVFIDTWHNYVQVLEELRRFAPKTNKYIILHDTTIDGITSECVRLGYEPRHYDACVKQWNNKYTIEDFKTGLLQGIGQFLEENPEWHLWESYNNNNGLTVLKYVNFLSQE